MYLCDMYREVIEFPSAIPEDILKIIDVTNGRDKGRIWRIMPDHFKRPPSPKLGKATAGELVELFEHPNSWQRETAQRLLFERQDKSVVPALKKLMAESKSPQGRLHALCTLDGLASLDHQALMVGMNDAHPAVRIHALRLAEAMLSTSPPLRERAITLAGDVDVKVRMQAAFSLGAIAGDPKVHQALAEVLAKDGHDRWLTTAVLSSIGDIPADFFVYLLKHERFLKTPKSTDVLSQLLGMIGARQKPAEATTILRTLVQPPLSDRPELQQSAMLGLADALNRSGQPLAAYLQGDSADVKAARALHDRLIENSHRSASDAKAKREDRLLGIRYLRHGEWHATVKVLMPLFNINESLDVQLAALQSLSGFSHDDVGKLIVQSWPALSPRVRGEAIEALFRDDRRVDALLTGLEKNIIRHVEIPPVWQQALRKHKNATLRKRAEALLAKFTPANRREVLEKYQAALKRDADAGRGEKMFAKHCATCHRFGQEGKSVGPDLAQAQKQSPEQLLIAILDPNREVDRQFLNYVVVTKSGRTLSGIIAAEGASSITLRRAEGAEDLLLRSEIEELSSTGQSLMPEGIEQQIDVQQMADLLRFLKAPPGGTPK
ncbi:MAG: c-type cytochrome [Planctomycetes bacterium]|nr:c-type cytochrome [Planctomycetota bacterium]